MAFDNFKNFARVTVSTGYDATAVSVVLVTGQGAKLPAAPFNVTWWNYTDYTDPTDDPNVEIVRVTAVATDTLTITRAQENTSAATHNTGGKTYRMVATGSAKTINADIPRQLAGGLGLLAQNPISYTSFLPSAISIPASYLGVGDRLVIKAQFTHTAAFVNTQSYRILFGGADCGTVSGLSASTGGLLLTAEICVQSMTVQQSTFQATVGTGIAPCGETLPGLTLTSTNAVDIQAKLDAGPGSDLLNLSHYSLVLHRAN